MSVAAVAHLEQLFAYLNDPAQAPHKNPPQPPTPEVGYEIMASANKVMAVMLDRLLTGEVHMNPCPEAILAAAEMADRAIDGKLVPGECLEIARRFGWKGGDGGNT